MNFKLLSRTALATIGIAAGGDDDAGPGPGEGGTEQPATPAPAPTPAPTPAPSPAGDPPPAAPEATTDVVTAADARASIAEADAAGFARANARMTAVFASDEGKANASLAAFMLANSSADAPKIIEQLKAQGPAAAAPAAPAATTTIPDTKVDIGVDPTVLAGDKGPAAEAEDGWDAAIKAHANSQAPMIAAVVNAQGHVISPAIPRTGN